MKSFWLPKNLYEAIPLVCLAVGLFAVAGAFWVARYWGYWTIATFLVVGAGVISIILGIVIFRMRRDYRRKSAWARHIEQSKTPADDVSK